MDNTVFNGIPDEGCKEVQTPSLHEEAESVIQGETAMISAEEKVEYLIPEAQEIECLDMLCFQEHVIDWFRSIEGLTKERDTTFIADARKLDGFTQWKPTRNHGIILGVYNDALNEVEHCRFVDCDSLDARTQEVLGTEKLVVLQ